MKRKKMLSERQAWREIAEIFDDPHRYATVLAPFTFGGLCDVIYALSSTGVISYSTKQQMIYRVNVFKALYKESPDYVWPILDRKVRVIAALLLQINCTEYPDPLMMPMNIRGYYNEVTKCMEEDPWSLEHWDSYL